MPELAPWNGRSDIEPDIFIVRGVVEAPLQGTEKRWVTVDTEGRVCIHIPNVVRILVEGGRRMTVDVLCDESKPDWRLFILGAGVGFLCHQRGAFPLHAASLAIGDRTVALAGVTGAGKSTLTMALLRRGHRLLSDDLTVLSVGERNVFVLPAFARLKLWRDTLEAIGESVSGLARVREGMDKFDLRPGHDFDPAPRRLDAIVLLRSGARPMLQPVSPPTAVPLIEGQVARPVVARMLGRQPGLFAAAAAVAGLVPVARLLRPMDFAFLEETARLVEDMVAA